MAAARPARSVTPPLAFACATALAVGCSAPRAGRATRPRAPTVVPAPPTPVTPSPALAGASWLAGAWASGDGAARETWLASGALLLGVGFRAEGGRTAFWEVMTVDADDGLLRLRAMPAGAAATEFEAEDVGPGRIAFDNPAHDAPKRIAYERRGDRLAAHTFDAGPRPAASFSWRLAAAAPAPTLEAADRRLDAEVAARGAGALVDALDERGALVRNGRRTGRDAARASPPADVRGGGVAHRTLAASGWSPSRDAGFTAGRWRADRPPEGDAGAPAARGTYVRVWSTAAGPGAPRLLVDALFADPADPAPPARSRFRWPLPDGWRPETIALPPEFAPDLGVRGLEEARFAPRFFDPSAETYFSYSFVWLLEGEPRLDAGTLGEGLRRYFAGLMRAVARDEGRRAAADATAARLADAGRARWAGTVDTLDAFGDGRPLRLQIEAEAGACAGRATVLFTLSPRPPGDATWARLREQRQLFRCKPP
jgi:hypothetical protein